MSNEEIRSDDERFMAERMLAAAPELRPSFRAQLRRHLGDAAIARRALLAHVRRQALAYAASGAVLFAIALAGLAGIGPFAA